MIRALSPSSDLGTSALVATLALAVAALALLVVELRRRRGSTVGVGVSGVVAVAALVLAILRPAWVDSQSKRVGARVVALVDASRSMELPVGPRAGAAARDEVAREALAKLRERFADARLEVLAFGEGAPTPLDATTGRASRSDLAAALSSLGRAVDAPPSAIVVVGDGRLDAPSAGAAEAETRAALGDLHAPVHTVRVGDEPVADASVLAVRTSGAAVAHQPFPLGVSIGCTGGLACGEIVVTARELVERGAPRVLAVGRASVEGERADVELSITFDRAGTRVVEVAIDSPKGDRVPANDRRLVTFDVTRDRVRVLHVAGRPSYDVRALRMWLKADASLDLVTFFILRGLDANAADDELSLIPFPVDELFTEHLSSFDAIVLQDFQAVRYKLARHLPALARYVEHGGGLVMVGGAEAFGGGGYVGTPLASVLPVVLGDAEAREPVDVAAFVPRATPSSADVPALAELRRLLGDRLPEMSGANRVGDPRPGALVLWEHPSLRTPSGAPMPLLALGEEGDGRAIALAVDGTYRLQYGAAAADTAGRAYAALWDGLVGWLMRDPRFEVAEVRVARPCVAGTATELRVRPALAGSGELRVELRTLGDARTVGTWSAPRPPAGAAALVPLGVLGEGGYQALVRLGEGPPIRRDFACEGGGDELADVRPDPDRLRAVAKATGGESVDAADAAKLPTPASVEVLAERRVAPVLPPWAWSLAAAIALGAHWIARRRLGLS